MGSLETIAIGTDKQLFLDESIIESRKGVRLQMNPAMKTGELLISPDSDPGARINSYSSVMKEGDLIRVWYDDREHFCSRYAESEDGIHFVKPDLGLIDADGPMPGNAVLAKHRLQGCCVWIDLRAPPAQRYKTQAKCGPHPDKPSTLDFFSSADGLHWKPMHSIEMEDIDTQNVVFWDESYSRYVMYTRRWVRFTDANLNHRKVRRMESDDLVHWDTQSIVWEADEEDRATHGTSTGMHPVDYYGACVFKYPDAGDLYILLAQAFWHWKDRPPEERWGYSPDPQRRKKRVERLGPSTMDVRLGLSHDGKAFCRSVDRGPFISLGPDGRFDSKLVWAMPNPIRMGDELWFYYAGGNTDHDGFVDPISSHLLSGISRAVLRLDGFVSADADYSGGQLTTRPILYEGERLELNADTFGGGCIQVELLDKGGKPIEGFTRNDSQPLYGNSVAMRWNTGKSLGVLAGQAVRLRFIMQDCKLYAFQFRE